MRFSLSEEISRRQLLIDEKIKEIEHLDEPIFVLRAQDISAPALIRLWIILNRDAPKEKLKSAKKILDDMLLWPIKKKAD